MFENVPPNLPTSKEPEDIFSGSGSKPASPPVRPQPPAPPRPSAPPPAPRPASPQGAALPQSRPAQPPTQPFRPAVPQSSPAPQAPRPAPTPVILEKPSRSWVRVVLALAVLGGLGAGAYFFVAKGGIDLILKPKADTPAPQAPINSQLPPPPVGETQSAPPPEAETIVPPPPIDSDGDGLTDEDEARLGTDPLKADSDDDGLLDNEEVRIYKSDPMVPDTDGDGYKDGDEVKNGYNPIGPGRLFQVPAQQ